MFRLRLLAALFCLLTLAPIASAQWPMQGRSPGRDGASPSQADLAEPALAWRHYLGGSILRNATFSWDIDDDGRSEILYVSGGKLVCKRDDGRVAWETAPFTLNTVHAIVDLDGDGDLEVLTSGRPAILAVFALADGALLWRTEPDTFGVGLGMVRVGQLVPGGPPEVFTADRMGGDTNSRPDAVYAFSFAAGFGSGRIDDDTTLWRQDASDHADPVASGTVLVDLDGDGSKEVLFFDEQRASERGFLHLYEGRTGVRRGPAMGYPMGIPLARGLTRASRVIDLDGDGNEEIVVSTDIAGYSPVSRNSRAIMVIDWDDSRAEGERLFVRWSYHVPSIPDDAHRYIHANVADLEGDGTLEVVSTFFEGSAITTYVFDGMSGTVRTSMNDATFRGVVRLDDGLPTVMIRSGGMLRGYELVEGALNEQFVLPSRPMANEYPRDWAALSQARGRPMTLPLPDAPERQGVLLTSSSRIELWDPASTAAPVATFAVDAPLEISNWVPQTGVGGTLRGLLVARSDGFLDVVNGRLEKPSSSVEFPIRGLRIGGFYSGRSGLGTTPIGARAGGASPSIFVIDGRADLVRLEVDQATITEPPTETWRWPGARRPVLIDENNDGLYEEIVAQIGRGIEGRRTTDGTTETFAVRNVRADPLDTFSGDHVPLTTPTGTRFAVPIHTRGGDALIRAVNREGIAWSSASVRAGSSQAGYIAADDLDDDGTDDVLVALMNLTAVFGHDGSHQNFPATSSYPAMPIVMGARAAGSVTHIATGGTAAAAISITSAGPGMVAREVLWNHPTDLNNLRHFATLVECPNTMMVGAAAESAIVHVTDVASHSDRAAPTTAVLVGGRLFSTLAEATEAGEYPGALGNMVSIADYDGGGHPAAFVGSTDGYLYALNPCPNPPVLLWALNLRSPVGEPILLDTDNDGSEEIVVSVQDGFLYGIDTEVAPSPAPVFDILPGGAIDVDVDETRAPALAAAWANVTGATGYEWAVFTAGGSPVSRNADDPTNPFTAVGADVTSVTYGAGLEDGAAYFFAVRTLVEAGNSSEAVSDGTRFFRTAPPRPDAGVSDDGGAMRDAGADGGFGSDSGMGSTGDEAGCGCRVGTDARSPRWPAFLVLWVLGWRSQRRRP